MSALRKGIFDSKKQSPVSLNRDKSALNCTRKKWMWFNWAENCIVICENEMRVERQHFEFFKRSPSYIVTTTKIQLMFNLSHVNNFSLPTLRTRSMLSSNFLYAGEKFSGRFVVAISVCSVPSLSILYHLAISLCCANVHNVCRLEFNYHWE